MQVMRTILAKTGSGKNEVTALPASVLAENTWM